MRKNTKAKAKVIRLYSQGFSIRQIADITGISKSTVHRIVNGEVGKERKRGEKNLQIYKSMSEKLKSKLKTLLTLRTEEKA